MSKEAKTDNFYNSSQQDCQAVFVGIVCPALPLGVAVACVEPHGACADLSAMYVIVLHAGRAALYFVVSLH
jgi:hypothetical protein